MTERAELLELIHTSVRRWETLHARGWEWRHSARLREAWQRNRPEGAQPLTSGAASIDEHEPGETTEPWELWLAKPDMIRAEFVVGDETVTAVIRGETWWSWAPARDARTNEGDPHSSHGIGPGEILLDPASILPALEFNLLGEETFAARLVVAVSAAPVPVERSDEDYRDWSFATHTLGFGADEYRLLVDAERGVVLRSEARFDGEPFRTISIDDISFDEAFGDETFTPPESERFEPVTVPLPIPVEKLTEHVSFTVLVPEHPPIAVDDAEIHAAEQERPEQVVISYASHFMNEDDRAFWLVESAQPLPAGRQAEWRESKGMRYGEDRNIDPPLRVVRLEQAGTNVELYSYYYSVDELLQLAGSLVPI
jgi:outer membrane lipoprotein-sorting protein